MIAHVGLITNDATRLNQFYIDVFDAEILRDGAEPGPGGANGVRMSRSGDGNRHSAAVRRAQ